MVDTSATRKSQPKIRTSRRGKKTPFGERLRKLVGPVFMVKNSSRPTRMSNAKWIAFFNQFGHDPQRHLALAYYDINGHERGETQLKVSTRFGFETLFYFDLDTHATGDTQDVELMAQVIRQHFPTMPEFVINNRGGSGWLKVDTSGLTRDELNILVDRLEAYFRSVAKSMAFDIQFVEVKGKVYVPQLNARGRCISVKAGDLLKCPPDLTYLDQPAVEAARFASAEFDPWEDNFDIVQGDQNSDTNLVNVYTTDPHQHAGSFRPVSITEDMAARLTDLEAFVTEKFADRPTHIGKRKITPRQFAEVLLTLFVLKPNGDGTNPYLRHERFIEVLHEAGVFQYGFRFEKYKSVRDYLSRIGGIHWIDHTHRPKRKGVPGQACKWRLDPVLTAEVEALVSGKNNTHSDLVTTRHPYSGQHKTPTMLRLSEVLTAEDYEAVERLFSKVLAA